MFWRAKKLLDFGRTRGFSYKMAGISFMAYTYYNQNPYQYILGECAAKYDKSKITVLDEKYPIIKYLLSQLRDKNTETPEFRHFSNRVMHMLIEEAIS